MAAESRSFLSSLKRLLAPPPPPPAGVPASPSQPPAPATEAESLARTGPGGPAATAPGRLSDVLRVQALTVSLLTKKVSADQLFRHVVEGAAGCLGADEASLMLAEAEELRVVAATEGRRDALGWREPVRRGEGVSGLVAQTGSPVLLNEGDDLTRFPNLAPKGGRIRSAMSVPLEVGGRVVGVLNANRLAGGPRFTQEDLAVLRLFAGTAALAIDQASLLQRTQSRSRALEALPGITEAFAAGLEPVPALTGLMPRLGAVFHPALGLAFLGPAEGERLAAVAGWTPAAGTWDSAALGPGRLPWSAELAEIFTRPSRCGSTRSRWKGSRRTSVRSRCVSWRYRWRHRRRGHAASSCSPGPRPASSFPRRTFASWTGWGARSRWPCRQDRASAAGSLEHEMAEVRANLSEARAHLVEVERLATMGQTMAGLVHDVNAPLAALMTFAQLIQRESGEAQSRERAAHIVEAARRAQRLVRELLTMARPRPPSHEPVDINALLRASIELERPQCSASGYRMVTDLAADLPSVTADAHRLGQVFTNLLVNARQAMDAAEKGRALTVRTSRRNGTVEVRVEDDGPGIPAALHGKIFDWFYTTKPPGEGTGLGLAVSREIVLAHGGNLRVEDTPGGGASFVLELPVTEAGPSAQAT